MPAAGISSTAERPAAGCEPFIVTVIDHSVTIPVLRTFAACAHSLWPLAHTDTLRTQGTATSATTRSSLHHPHVSSRARGTFTPCAHRASSVARQPRDRVHTQQHCNHRARDTPSNTATPPQLSCEPQSHLARRSPSPAAPHSELSVRVQYHTHQAGLRPWPPTCCVWSCSVRELWRVHLAY